ncbi:MAG TPA: hypothetical protein VGD65_21435 [Chryseosolibacter sp.]
MTRILILTLMALSTLDSNGQTRKVLFVCEHGAGKSVVAAAYFNKIAKERNLNWEATCRGTDPDPEIGQSTKEGLTSDKLLETNLKPQKLAKTDTSGVERIIVFTRLPDDFAKSIRQEDWSAVKNIDGTYQMRKEALIKKINEFFDSVEKQK